MALQKSKTLENGVSGNHWKITFAGINVVNGAITVNADLALFVSSVYKDTYPLALKKSFRFLCVGADITGDLREWAYEKIKLAGDSDLDGATDV